MPTTQKQLAAQLTKRLLAYSGVAGAVAAVPAAAEVIYTPVHRNVELNYHLDLNNDGITDFLIHSSQLSSFGKLQVVPEVTGNRIAAVHAHCYFSTMAAAALASGAQINPDTPQLAQANCMAGEVEDSLNGPWLGEKNHYLGFSFVISGQKHFGWARLSMNNIGCYGCMATITGYAYETIPGKPIIAGDEGNSTETSTQPASLGALALGAPAFSFWRNQEAENANNVH
jgi:hypothetical protein